MLLARNSPAANLRAVGQTWVADIDTSSDSRSTLGDTAVFILVVAGLYAGYVLPAVLVTLKLLQRPDAEFISATGSFLVLLALATTRFRRVSRPSRALWISGVAGYALYLVLFLTGAFRALR